jgi:hypothetical protein
MPIELAIKKILFPEIPKTGFGVDRVIKEFSSKQQELLELIATDLSAIVSHGIGRPTCENPEQEILNPLRAFFNSVQNLPDYEIKETLQQQLRYFALTLQLRLSQITDDNAKVQLENFLQEVAKAVGIVPRLNDRIPLPEKDFLPPDFENSKKTWKDTLMESPSRGSIRFFTIKRTVNQKEIEIASVRLYLLSLDVNARNQNEALSYVDADIFLIGDLQADHLQPSEKIIKRQQEMLEAMGIDPEFAKEMNKHPESENYFKKKEDGEYVGTKYFYTLYHNCITNLWLISTSANTGAGKGSQDPIVWLKTHKRFGERFFSAIGGEGSINKSTLLYVTRDGEMLAQAARKWFLNTYKNEIAGARYIREEILKPIKENLQELAQDPQEESELSARQTRKKIIKTMAKMVIAKILVAESSSESPGHSDTSPNKSSSPEGYAEINPSNLESMEAVGKEFVAALKATKKTMAASYKQAQKKLPSKESSTSNTRDQLNQTVSSSTASAQTSAATTNIAASVQQEEPLDNDDTLDIRSPSLSNKRKWEE